MLTPVPLVAIEFGEFVALLVRVTFPVTDPVAFGTNITFKFAVWPAAIVAPRTPLDTLKPVPDTVIADTVKLELPVFLTATTSELDPPTVSFPKLTLVVERDIVFVEPAPVPLRGIVSVEFAAVLLNVMFPEKLPAADGV